MRNAPRRQFKTNWACDADDGEITKPSNQTMTRAEIRRRMSPKSPVGDFMNERRNAICRVLQNHGSMNVFEIATRVRAASKTVMDDLLVLIKSGEVRRSEGQSSQYRQFEYCPEI